jgi:hypothetical protein
MLLGETLGVTLGPLGDELGAVLGDGLGTAGAELSVALGASAQLGQLGAALGEELAQHSTAALKKSS